MSMVERVNSFLQSAWLESKKVTWPTREELTDSTRVVVVATILMMLFLFVVDRALTLLVNVFIR